MNASDDSVVTPTSFAVTGSVRQVLLASQAQAQKQGQAEVNCVHVLWTLLEQDEGVRAVLTPLHADLKILQSKLLQMNGNGHSLLEERTPVTPELGAEVVEALRKATHLGLGTVTSFLLLLGIADSSSAAGGLLQELGLRPDRVGEMLQKYPALRRGTGEKITRFELAGAKVTGRESIVEPPEEKVKPTASSSSRGQKKASARQSSIYEAPPGVEAIIDSYDKHKDAYEAAKKSIPPPPALALLNEDDVFIQDNEVPAIGVTDIAAELCNLIRNLRTADRGKMVGVFGAWGRGKTFLLDLIGARMRNGPEPFHQVKFHAWKYQDTPASWAYLYEAFANAYYADPTGESGPVVWRRARKILRLNLLRNGYYSLVATVVGVLLLLAAGVYLYRSPAVHVARDESEAYVALALAGVVMPVSIGLITFVRNALQASYNSALSLFNRYYRETSMEHLLGVQAEVQKELRILFQAWLGRQANAKVLLIVDDIDRCDEQKVIQIIDALRVMLEDPHISPRVVVLAAIDERILKNAIKHKYAEFFRRLATEQSAAEEYRTISEYLDKLFISGLRLGPLSSPEMCDIFSVYSQPHLQPEEAPQPESTTAQPSASADRPAAPSTQSEPLTQSAPVSGSPQPTPPVNGAAVKSSYALSGAESTFIKGLLMQQQVSMTPRQIRIYYYRYLLARNMLLKRLKLRAPAADSTLVREVLLRVLLVHFFQDTTTIAAAKQQVYAAPEPGPMPSLGPESPYRLSKPVMQEIYAVTELVTGY